MATEIEKASIADLEAAIEKKHQQVQLLMGKRADLEKEIEKLDLQMHNVTNLKSGGIRRTRPKNETSLKALIAQILAKYKKGLTISELHEKVIEAGYVSGSKNMKNVVYQAVYNSPDISKNEETGKYVLGK